MTIQELTDKRIKDGIEGFHFYLEEFNLETAKAMALEHTCLQAVIQYVNEYELPKPQVQAVTMDNFDHDTVNKNGQVIIKDGRQHVAIITYRPVFFAETTIRFNPDLPWSLELKDPAVLKEYKTLQELLDGFNDFFSLDTKQVEETAAKKEIAKFEVGKIYGGYLDCNEELLITYKVVSISASRKTMMIQDCLSPSSKPKRKKIYNNLGNAEIVYPDGLYSGCMDIDAGNPQEQEQEVVEQEVVEQEVVEQEVVEQEVGFQEFLKEFKDQEFVERFHNAVCGNPEKYKSGFFSYPEQEQIQRFSKAYECYKKKSLNKRHVEKYFMDGSRYEYDFELCSSKKEGWAQIDTDSDASYFGNWINPKKLKVLSYIEGDVIIQTAIDKEELLKIMEEIDNDYEDVKIDPGFNEALKNDLFDVGLEGYLY